MKFKFSLRILFSSLLLMSGFSESFLWAAACAPEIGEWAQYENSPSPEERSALTQNVFSQAKVVSGPRGVIHFKSGNSNLSGSYQVRHQWIGELLTLEFIKNGKSAGALELKLPQSWKHFQTQIPEMQTSMSQERQVYKELRFEGTFRAKGIFVRDISPNSRFRLILKGVGSRCFDASHYRHWVLQIMGQDPGILDRSRQIIYYWFTGPLAA